jgi:glycosyltransferase involved in cell wall biosynthesis
MKVSVIVPNYNHARYLRQRIDSILNQTFKDFELIILDDFSSDESRKIIDEYASAYPDIIRCYYNDCNSGNPFKQWDLGVSKAHGHFIWIAESDDFAESCFLEKTSEILINNEKVGLVYCNSRVIDQENRTEYFSSDCVKNLYGKKRSHDYTNNGRCEISEYLFRHNTINNVSGVLFRKSKYSEAGFADHSMKYCGDWYLYIRILLISDVAYISVPLNNLRLHAESSLHNYFRKSSYFLEVFRIYLFILSNISVATEQKFAMGRILLGISVRRLIKGHMPEFKEIIKTFSDHKRAQGIKNNRRLIAGD